MIRVFVLGVAVATGLAGCSDSKNRIAFDGQFFRAKIAKVDKQRDVFVVTVKDPAKSLEGARLAARHEGISYCLENYGTSDVDWVVDPLDEEAQLTIVKDQLTFQGRCPQAQRI